MLYYLPMILSFFLWFMMWTFPQIIWTMVLEKLMNEQYNGKMSFNPDPNKQPQEVIFSRKRQNLNHDSIYFDNNFVQQVLSQKDLGMHIDTKLNFEEHLDNIMSKDDNTICYCISFRQFYHTFP